MRREEVDNPGVNPRTGMRRGRRKVARKDSGGKRDKGRGDTKIGRPESGSIGHD